MRGSGFLKERSTQFAGSGILAAIGEAAGRVAVKLAYAAFCSPESLMKWDCAWCTDSGVGAATLHVMHHPPWLRAYVAAVPAAPLAPLVGDGDGHVIVVAFRWARPPARAPHRLARNSWAWWGGESSRPEPLALYITGGRITT